MFVTLKQDMLVQMVQTAIDCEKQMRIAYTDIAGNPTLRFVEPIKWLDTRNGLGILTKCHTREGEYRHFKLQQIDRILITDYDFCWVNPADEKERVGVTPTFFSLRGRGTMSSITEKAEMIARLREQLGQQQSHYETKEETLKRLRQQLTQTSIEPKENIERRAFLEQIGSLKAQLEQQKQQSDERFKALQDITIEQLSRMKKDLDKYKAFHAYFIDELYGLGLGVDGWHQNGDLAALDDFIENAISEMDAIDDKWEETK